MNQLDKLLLKIIQRMLRQDSNQQPSIRHQKVCLHPYSVVDSSWHLLNEKQCRRSLQRKPLACAHNI